MSRSSTSTPTEMKLAECRTTVTVHVCNLADSRFRTGTPSGVSLFQQTDGLVRIENKGSNRPVGYIWPGVIATTTPAI